VRKLFVFYCYSRKKAEKLWKNLKFLVCDPVAKKPELTGKKPVASTVFPFAGAGKQTL